MEATESSGVMQRLHSPFCSSSSSILKHDNQFDFDTPIFSASRTGAPFPQFSRNISNRSIKKTSIPPSHPHLPPYSMITPSRPASQQLGSQNLTNFLPDSLPPLSPLPSRDQSSATSSSESVSTDVSMEERNSSSSNAPVLAPTLTSGSTLRVNEGRLPPRRGHRRSNSDIPLAFSAMIQSSPQLIPIRNQGISDKSICGRQNLGVDKPVQLVKQEVEWNNDGNGNAEIICDRQREGEVVDDLLMTYMNLDNMDTLNSSLMEDGDMDSRASDTKANGGDISDNEVESSVNKITNSMNVTRLIFPSEKREGVKRSAGGDIAPAARHYRSVSMDSFMGNFNFSDESLKCPLIEGTQVGERPISNSMDGSLTRFSVEFGNGEFSRAELKKIMENERLAEIALSDPKRVKRILANRISAARSKERKLRYISELQHKVQTLQAEANTLSAQLTALQRDSAGLTSHNNELKFCLQAMKQQAQLRDALHETLTAEVQHLKLVAAELRGETHISNSSAQPHCKNSVMFQLQHQQSPQQLSFYQLQRQQQQELKQQ